MFHIQPSCLREEGFTPSFSGIYATVVAGGACVSASGNYGKKENTVYSVCVCECVRASFHTTPVGLDQNSELKFMKSDLSDERCVTPSRKTSA